MTVTGAEEPGESPVTRASYRPRKLGPVYMTSANESMSYEDQLLAAALDYASRGLAVFPAWVTRPDPASHSKKTHPIGAWDKASTTDAEQVKAWWGPNGSYRGAHVCVDTGKSGKVVIDLDHDAAVAYWDEFCASYGMDAGTVVHTPSGGQHRWYDADEAAPIRNGAGMLHDGVDVRGQGGLVFAAPSRDSAGAYSFDAPVPETFPPIKGDLVNAQIAQAKADRKPKSADASAFGAVGADEGAVRSWSKSGAKTYLQRQLSELANAPDGTINTTANNVACALSHFVPNFISAEAAWKAFEGALSRTVYDSATWDHERFRRIIDKSEPIEDDWVAVREDDFEVVMDAAEEAETSKKMTKRQQMEAKFLTSAGLASIAPPQWAVRDVLERDSLNWIFGPPGGGKSFTALDIAAHFSLGMDWRGHKVTKPGRVVYLVAEGVSGFVLRVRAWEKRYGRTLEDVLFYPEPIQVLQSMGREGLSSSEDFDVFCSIMAETVKPDMIILDTQARVSVGMDENSNTDAGVFVESMESLRRLTGACIILVHHTPKDGTKTLRGASALDGAATTEICVYKNKGVVHVENVKQKNGEAFEPKEGVFASIDVSEFAQDEHSPGTSAVVVDPKEARQEDGVLALADISELTPAVENILDLVEATVLSETEPYVKGISANALRPMIKQGEKGVGPGTLTQALEYLAHRGRLEHYKGDRGAKLWIGAGQSPE